MDTEFWRNLKTPINSELAFKRPPTKKDSAKTRFRNLIFRLLMPGVFMFTVCYHVFVFTPDSARFYLDLCYR